MYSSWPEGLMKWFEQTIKIVLVLKKSDVPNMYFNKFKNSETSMNYWL